MYARMTMVAKALKILTREDLEVVARAIGEAAAPEDFTRLDLEYALAKTQKRVELRQLIVLLIDKAMREDEEKAAL